MKFRSASVQTVIRALLAGSALVSFPASAQTEDAATTSEAPDIIVTGVLSARSIEKAPISIAAISSEQLQRQSATSAAEMLKNIPGVFVNSAFGETRAIVFSRGISANSLEASAGYYYVSLQEDGLPVETKTLDNFGPDYFSRPDIMLSRLEGLRGGTAAITGPNAPGGIFNYISRTGKSDSGYEVRAKYGLEGDGRNPFHRIDAYAGGQLGSSELYYAIGGFYRKSDGSRDPGYAMNEGGQVRANLLWDYGNGSLQLTGKYLDDRNSFVEFMPAINFNDPRIAPGFTNFSSMLPNANAAHDYIGRDGEERNWDPTNLVHSKSLSFGLNWEHELSDNWKVESRARFSRNRTEWNTIGLAFNLPINDFVYNFLAGNLLGPGAFTFRFPDTGAVAATVREDIIVLPSGPFPLLTVTENNLPNRNLLGDNIQGGVAYAPSFRSREFQNMLTLTGKAGDHTLSLGGYVSIGRLRSEVHDGGMQFATLEPNPRRLDVTFQSDFVPGVDFLVTDPTGWANQNRFFGGDGQTSKQQQYSLFAGDTWQVTDRLSIDAGVRYEKIKYNILSDTYIPFPGLLLGELGADGNPLTLYDNAPGTFGPPVRTRRSYDFFNYSASLSYAFSNRFNAYVRYTDSKKAPDLRVISAIDTPDEVANLFVKAQHIQQLEFGLKYYERGLSVQVFPFYSRLSNVTDTQLFTDNSGTVYSPPPTSGQIKTYGVEVQGSFDIGDRFNLTTAITLQNAQASGFGTYLENTSSRDDDALVLIPKGDADNNPKIITRTTATVELTPRLAVFATHSYLGKRPANRFNSFYLPGFHTIDLGASWKVSDNFQLQANVNNALGNYGVMSWAGSGFLSGLDRQSLTPADVAANPRGPFSIITSPPRSFFLTATAKF